MAGYPLIKNSQSPTKCYGIAERTNMKFLRHMSENLFVTLTGIAALVHSTWSLGTMFSGQAPTGDWIAYVGWVLPAFFVAFAMDIGQISTSAAIRHEGLTWQRAVTFCVFALATYYLQFLYIAHHLPLLNLAQGLSEFHRPNVKIAVDAAIWIMPLFLPLSTILYTLSGGDKKEQAIAPTLPEPTITIEKLKNEQLPANEENISEYPALTSFDGEIIQEPKYLATCEDCGWCKEYEHPQSASRALATHKNKHCPNRTPSANRDTASVTDNGANS
ncbi:MAG TPA: hypothetical protein V6C65_08970 [Allocoleopsis sp.]